MSSIGQRKLRDKRITKPPNYHLGVGQRRAAHQAFVRRLLPLLPLLLLALASTCDEKKVEAINLGNMRNDFGSRNDELQQQMPTQRTQYMLTYLQLTYFADIINIYSYP
ncbi:hypothetical protein ACLKA6_012952 [Drosophila palustris]